MRRFITLLRQPALALVLIGVALATCSDPVRVHTVASVEVVPTQLSLAVGSHGTLVANVKDVSGLPVTDARVDWSTSNASIASVSAAGDVSAVGAGTAVITATSNNFSGTSTVTVTAVTVPVASVSVTPATPSVIVGQTTQLTASAYDANNNVLTGRAVTWSSSNTGIATVSSSGVVTGVAAGSATITATSEGKSGTASVTVTPPPVASVSVSPATPSVTVGQTVQLTATAYDANNNVLTGRVVTWSSSNTGIASVSSSGVVTGVAAGTATITATSEGKSGTASVTVTPQPVASVTVAPSSSSITVGQTAQLTATTRDANNNDLSGRTVAWSSSNTGIATVSSSGVVTGVAAGSATITATSEGKSGTASVTVTAVTVPVASVTVAPSTPSINVGQTVQLTATTKDANGAVLSGRAVTWTSSNTGVATVSSSGVVTGVAVGSATITATSEGKSGTATVTVTAVPIPVATVSVSPATPSVIAGQTVQLTATARDANNNVLTGRAVTWSSSNSGIATVSSSGVVTGVAAGSATITATSEGKSGTATVTVTPVPVASVSVAPAAPSINVGQTVQLTATARDANNNVLTGRAVTWTSSNTGIATVSSSGVVTGVAPGSATITATSEGKSGTASVTVTVVPVASVSVAPASASVSVGQTTQLTATTRDANNNVLSGRAVTWSSSNTGIATVSPSGVVTGVAAGSATITATSEGKSGTSAITVYVSQGGVDFGAIVRGIRPRGYGVSAYSLLSPQGSGRVWYVATTGNDAAAGTTDAPLRTINRAAQLAVAGDVVTIRAGTYNESVVVRNSGAVGRPIVFQAEQRGTVVLTGGNHTWEGATWSGTVEPTGEFWITLRGLIFRQYSDPLSTQNAIAAVRVSRGWIIDDVWFDEAGKTAVEIRYSDVVITRSTFNRSYTNAIVSWAPSSSATGPSDPNFHPLTGIVISDVIISGNNIDPSPAVGDAAEYVTKLWATSGALIDNIESYGNYGQGFWFDTDNANFTIRNSYFHDNHPVPGSQDELGKGLFLEVGWAPGLVERNVFRDNNGAGLAIDNGAGIEVRDNLFIGNAQCITLVNNDRGNNPNGQPRWPLKDITMHDNQCKSWRSNAAIAATYGNFTTPSAMGVMADANVYDPLNNNVLADWPGLGPQTTLAGVRTKYGWETNGRIGPIAVP